MKCNEVINRFMELDNHQSIPISIRLHILQCKKCRNEIQTMQNSLDRLLVLSPFSLSRDMEQGISEALEQKGLAYTKEISYFKWILVGFILLVSRFAITFSDTLAWLQNYFGSRLDIPLNIVLGLVLSIYALLFIGTHMEDLKKVKYLYFK